MMKTFFHNKAIFGIFVLAVLAVGLFWFKPVPVVLGGLESYTSYGLSESSFWLQGQVAPVAEVLRYYGMDLNTATLEHISNTYNRVRFQDSFSLETIGLLAEDFGYKTSVIGFSNPKDFLPYLKKKEPVIVFAPYPVSGAENVPYWSVSVVVGVDSRHKVVVLDDYYRGPRKEVSFEDFMKSQEKLSDKTTRTMLVIEAKSDERRSSQSLIARNHLHDTHEFVAIRQAIARAAVLSGDNKTAIHISEEAIASPNFAESPKYFQVYLFSLHAGAKMIEEGDSGVASAREENRKALALNHDLNALEGPAWGGYHVRDGGDKIANPYFIQGLIEYQEKNYKEAISWLDKALAIEDTSVVRAWKVKAEEALKTGKK